MAVFAVSFRLADGPNYADRWSLLDGAIRQLAQGAVFDETTSFYVFGSQLDATGLHAAILARAKMSTQDTLVVINLSVKDHQMSGCAKPQLLNGLLNGR